MSSAAGPVVVFAAHAIHLSIVLGGAAVLAALLWAPDVRRARQSTEVAELRAAVDAGSLIPLATERASVALAERPAITVVAEQATATVPVRPRSHPGRRDRHVQVAALASLGAASVHAAVTRDHFAEGVLLGIFFLVAALGQVVWAAVVLRRPARLWLVAGLVANVAMLVLWTVSRTVGVPVAGKESIGAWDSVAGVYEIVLIVWCALALRARPGADATTRRSPVVLSPTLLRSGVIGIAAVTAFLALAHAPA